MNRCPRLWALDANVLVRHLMGDNEELSPKANSILLAVQRGEITAFLDPVTLSEAVFVLGSVYKVPAGALVEGLDPILKSPSLNLPGKDRYLRALRLFGESVSSYGDACACAAALECCEGRLYSFDGELSGVEEVEREAVNQ